MIPFIDLKAQRARIGAEVERRIQCVLRHGNFIMGQEVAELESRLGQFCGVRHAVSCSSGTDALLLVLMAHGVGPGDAVFTTPFTFIATAEVISLLGATPVFVDIDPETYNLDPDSLDAAIAGLGDAPGRSLTPRGVIAVDLFGLAADYQRINAVAAKHGLFVLEDAAQSFGGLSHGRRAGSLAHAAATSFFPAKPLGCYGDGGAVFTDDGDFADVLRSLRVHGKGDTKYDNVRIGLNARLDTLQAAILLAKLDIFPDELEKRRLAAQTYTRLAAGILGVVVPVVPEGCESAWAQYTLRVPGRDGVQAALKAAGIPTAVYYATPLHLQKAFAHLGYAPGDLPHSEAAARSVLSLPFHPYLEPETQREVMRALGACLADIPVPTSL